MGRDEQGSDILHHHTASWYSERQSTKVPMFMNRYALSHLQDRGVRPRHHYIAMLFGVPLVVTLMMGFFSFAEFPALRSEEQVAEHAKAVWESGAIIPALEILAQVIQHHPQARKLLNLPEDILTTS